MKQMNTPKSYMALCAIFLWSTTILADLSVSPLFGKDMVIQRGKPIPVWGTADSGEEVSVSFAGQTKTAKADSDGSWKITLDPLKTSGKGETMTVKGKNSLNFDNILVGDVWVCSGQSNMVYGMKGVLDSEKEAADAKNYPQIRYRGVGCSQKIFRDKNSQLSGTWRVCSSQNVKYFNGVGYFFARELYKSLQIPVGIINVSWNGQRIDPFIAPEGYALVPELNKINESVQHYEKLTDEQKKKYQEIIRQYDMESKKAISEKRSRPPFPKEIPQLLGTGAYNAMVYPMIAFPIKGVLWYQGCSNANDRSYLYKMKAFIVGWRKAWKDETLPFYFVQLASFKDPSSNPGGGDGFAPIREIQRKSMSIPLTGMAVTIDIGNAKNIHPKNKQDVGKRLAFWALNKTYGKQDVVCSGPLFQSLKIEGNKARVSFSYAESGLMTGEKKGLAPTQELPNGKLAQFFIAGKDQKWYRANAVIVGKDVVVTSPDVPNPVAVRYAYRGNPEGCNLYNKAGLPASPFRTDEWRK